MLYAEQLWHGSKSWVKAKYCSKCHTTTSSHVKYSLPDWILHMDSNVCLFDFNLLTLLYMPLSASRINRFLLFPYCFSLSVSFLVCSFFPLAEPSLSLCSICGNSLPADSNSLTLTLTRALSRPGSEALVHCKSLFTEEIIANEVKELQERSCTKEKLLCTD